MVLIPCISGGAIIHMWTPGDFNGDHKADYVDYQIYTNYIDPGTAPRQPSYYGSSKSNTDWKLVAISFIVGLLVCGIFSSAFGSSDLALFATVATMIITMIVYVIAKNRAKKREDLEQNQKTGNHDTIP